MTGQLFNRLALSGDWAAMTENDQLWRRLSYGLMLVVGLIMLATFLDYGITWDEEVQRIYGDNVLAWYGSFFRNRAALDFTFTYGGFFEAVAQLATKPLPFGIYESRHLINCLFGLGAVAIAYRLGAFLARPMAGFFSALFLTLTPVFYGHSFNNSKDIPFSTLYLLSLYYIFVSLTHLPKIPKRLVIKIGVSTGLAMGVRVGGLMLLGYLAAFWIGWLVVQFALKSPALADNRRSPLAHLSLSFASILALAWAVMLVCWPWAQVKPLLNPVKALAQFARLENVPKSLFNGQLIRGTDLPWSYLPTWLSISLPEFYLIALLAGCVLAVRFILTFKKDAKHFDELFKMVFLALAACLPLLAAILMRSRLYDGLRHFLFTLPPLAILAAVCFVKVLRSRANRLPKLALSLLILLSVGVTVVDMVQLHPYQYVYFNRAIAGGVKHASEQFETDYWGASYKEGAQWVIDNYQPQAQEKFRVANCSNRFLTAYYFDKSETARERFESVQDHQNPHIFLATTRSNCHLKRGGKVLHVVERQGTPFLYVLELKPPP